MAHTPDAKTLAAEFDMFVARAGVTIPADRHAGIVAGYADFRAQIMLLHAPRSHTAEMANIFRLTKLEPRR